MKLCKFSTTSTKFTITKVITMKKHWSIFFLFLISIHFLEYFAPDNIHNTMIFTRPCQAQDERFQYQRYENRKEGIVNRKELIAGEKLVLISASIENNEKLDNNREPEKLNLDFCINDSVKIKIQVREFEHNYLMVPLNENYGKGKHTFQWPAEIANFYKITHQEMLPLGMVKSNHSKKIVPMMIYNSKPKNLTVVYKFSFYPHQTIFQLKYYIYGSNINQPIFSDERKNLIKDEIFDLRWNGRDTYDQPAPNGQYNLFVEATFQPAFGSVNYRKIPLTFQFDHFANFLKLKATK